MSQKNYDEIKHWHIYAITSRSNELAYVAKSCARTPIARYYEHIRGENKWTKDVFGPNGDSLGSEFLVLESLDCTESVAYWHIIAWCHYFEKQGFLLLNKSTKKHQFYRLEPEAQKIYDAVCASASLSELFKQKVIYARTDEDVLFFLPDKPKCKSQMTQLNIRVHRNVAKSFRKFCQQNHLSQNNALALLLAPENQDRLGSVNGPWKELQRREKLLKQFEERHKKEINIHERERNYRKVIAAISNEAIDTIKRNCDEDFAERPVLLSPVRFEDAKQQFDFKNYHYPDKSGVEKITLVGIVEGKQKMGAYIDSFLPPALFVLGENDAGDKVKLRWYAREDNVGISPRNELYAYSGARWLTGFVVAPDGAVDLIAVIPLALIDKGSDSRAHANIDDKQISPLDERIRDAMERSQGESSY